MSRYSPHVHGRHDFGPNDIEHTARTLHDALIVRNGIRAEVSISRERASLPVIEVTRMLALDLITFASE